MGYLQRHYDTKMYLVRQLYAYQGQGSTSFGIIEPLDIQWENR